MLRLVESTADNPPLVSDYDLREWATDLTQLPPHLVDCLHSIQSWLNPDQQWEAERFYQDDKDDDTAEWVFSFSFHSQKPPTYRKGGKRYLDIPAVFQNRVIEENISHILVKGPQELRRYATIPLCPVGPYRPFSQLDQATNRYFVMGIDANPFLWYSGELPLKSDPSKMIVDITLEDPLLNYRKYTKLIDLPQLLSLEELPPLY